MYAQVAINAPVDSTYDYHVPPELDGRLQPGHLVQVPFGTAMQHGVVVGLSATTTLSRTKPIIARLDPKPALTEAQIDLARWISRSYLAPLGPCLWLLLPPGITGGRDLRVTLLDEDAVPRDDLEADVLALLKRRGPLRGAQLTAALPGKQWRAAVDALAKAGVVDKESILHAPRVRARTVRTVALAVNPNAIDDGLRLLARPSRAADLLETIIGFNGTLLRTRSNQRHANRLIEAGWVSLAPDGTLSLAVPPEAAREHVRVLRKVERPARILELLAREGVLEATTVYEKTGASLADLKRLDEEDLITLGEEDSWRDSLADRDFVAATPPALTPEQQAAWARIQPSLQALNRPPDPGSNPSGQKADPTLPTCFLLHGVTGSGKTEIYLRAIEETLRQGRDAIFLVPEIALTAQTVRRVASRFAQQVAIVHSGLGPGERYDTWRRAREGLIRVVVGARSALFTPLRDVGLIVLDEEHDHSYKQSESGVGLPPPYYHALQVAEEMMRRNRGILILGSATPDLETSFRARRGDIQLLRMPNRIMGHRADIQAQAKREGVTPRYTAGSDSDVVPDAVMMDLPPVEVIDMRSELKRGNTSIFSHTLQKAVYETLERGEQAILFINRRGQATYVFCRDCGYVATCPRCDSPLTHHRQGQALRCHRCGYEQPEPRVCPQCNSARIKFFGAGTQQVEQALHELFPKARTARWDADTAETPHAHEAILQRFVDREGDIIVGTQMIAKGLDLPLVTLVGVVSADLGLALPDFRATERTFQILTQVAGRAGRGLLGGQVVLQTYQPDHYVIDAASRHDYEAFYRREIAYRREMGYPPFRRFVRIIFRSNIEQKARQEAERATALLRQRVKTLHLTGTDLIGPAPCFFGKINDTYRWHVLLRGPNPTVALEGIDIPRGWFVDVDPADVL